MDYKKTLQDLSNDHLNALSNPPMRMNPRNFQKQHTTHTLEEYETALQLMRENARSNDELTQVGVYNLYLNDFR